MQTQHEKAAISLGSTLKTYLLGSLSRLLLRETLTIFVFHSVTDTPSEFDQEFDLNIPPSTFEYIVGFIKTHFNCINPDDLRNGTVPTRSALITFDDGKRDVFLNALPILARHELPSLIFLNWEPINEGVFWAGLINYLCNHRPDFVSFLRTEVPSLSDDKPLFISCSRKIVDRYLRDVGMDFVDEVGQYVGPFATVQDLEHAADQPLVYYGNHLYNHDVALLLTDQELLDSYRRNAVELQRYSNYRDLIAFPFGEPGDTFSQKQVALLLDGVAEYVFSCSGEINRKPLGKYLHRTQVIPGQNSWFGFWIHLFQKARYQ